MQNFNENWDGIVRNNGIMSFSERNRFVQTMQSTPWLDESIHFTTEEILHLEEGILKMSGAKIAELIKRAAASLVSKFDTLSGVPKITIQACVDYSSGKIDFGKFKSILSKCNIPSSALDYLKPKFEKLAVRGRTQKEFFDNREDEKDGGGGFIFPLVPLPLIALLLYLSNKSAAAKKAADVAAQKVPELLARPEVSQAIEQVTQNPGIPVKYVVIGLFCLIALLALVAGEYGNYQRRKRMSDW